MGHDNFAWGNLYCWLGTTIKFFKLCTDISLYVPHPSVLSPSLPRGGGVGTRSSCRRLLALPFILGMVYVCGKIMVGRVLLCTRTTASTIKRKTNHNTVVEKGRNGNAMVDDRRTSILSGTETELVNEVIRKCWERLSYNYNSTDNARLT